MPDRSFLSKKWGIVVYISAAFWLILQSFNNTPAQDVTATIDLNPEKGVASISGSFARVPKARNISFTLGYAGIQGLGGRVSGLQLLDAAGQPVESRRLIPGEYLASGDPLKWSYSSDLTPLPQPFAAAHLSWLTDGRGVLMLGDLLPQTSAGNGAKITIKLPDGWHVYTTEHASGPDSYDVTDIDKAVFIVGKDVRETANAVDGARIAVDVSGEWLFKDAEAADMAAEIVRRYRKLFDGDPGPEFRVFLTRFPQSRVDIGSWEADTRGRTVTIASSDMPFRSQSLQRLHEQLRHEIFHLWIPNGISLKGRYDWFYEGFALYQSLKTGVEVSRIRFEDMLNTLSQARAIDTSRSRKVSLTEASSSRWSGSEAEVYARGMLVAFLCDLSMMKASGGKRTTADLLRRLYREYHTATVRKDGNEAILEMMRSIPELRPIVDSYIAGAEPIVWSELIRGAGLEEVGNALRVVAKPTRGQKALLDKLGYNSWRILSGNN